MVREIKKIYIDSHFRNDSSRSSAEFSIQLNESMLLPEDTAVIASHMVHHRI